MLEEILKGFLKIAIPKIFMSWFEGAVDKIRYKLISKYLFEQISLSTSSIMHFLNNEGIDNYEFKSFTESFIILLDEEHIDIEFLAKNNYNIQEIYTTLNDKNKSKMIIDIDQFSRYKIFITYFFELICNNANKFPKWQYHSIVNISQNINELQNSVDLIKCYIENLDVSVPSISASIDKVYYYNQIKIFIIENQLLYDESNNTYNIYSDIYDFLSKKTTWKMNVLKSINKVLHLDNIYEQYFSQVLDNIDRNIEYKQIVIEVEQSLRNLPGQLKSNNNNYIYQIKSTLSKSFEKVLLVAGEPGTGKTKFVECFLEYSIKHFEIITIPLLWSDFINDNNTIISIINALNKYFNIRLTDKESLYKLFDNFEEQSKIYFIFDDIQILISKNPSLFKELKTIVKEFTKYDFIHWCLIINEYELDMVLESHDFIRDYCFYNIDFLDVSENYYVDLDTVNQKYNLFKSIVSNSSDIIIFDEMEDYNHLLSNPLIAHIIAKTSTQIELDVINIYYLDFIKKLSEYKMKQLIQYSSREVSFNDKFATITKELNNLLSNFIDSKSLKITDVMANGYPSLIDELCFSHLIRKCYIKEDDYYSDFETIVTAEWRICLKIYWSYKLILFIRNKELNEVLQLCESIGEISDDLIAFYILYLDRESHNEKLKDLIYHIINKASNRNILLFTAPKASKYMQHLLSDILLNSDIGELSKSETFALMYFLKNSNISVLDACKILCKYIGQVNSSGLLVYLGRTYSCILDRISNLKSLKKCVNMFFNVPYSDINSILAEYSADKFINLVDSDNVYNTVDYFTEYLYQIVNSGIIDIEYYNSIKSGNLFSFADFFLQSYFEYVIYSDDINRFKLHQIFLHKNYYFNENQKFISRLTRRIIAIVYGRLYRKSNDMKLKNRYVDCIEELLEYDEERYIIFAFHFISNTLYNDRGKEETIEKILRPLLIQIYNDERLNKFCTQNKERLEFFQRNIHD